MHSQVKVIEHPLIQHKLTLMRKAETTTTTFRVLLKEISLLLTYEITRDLPLKYEQIKTPLAPMNAPVIALDKKLVIVSIQRAGQGILDGILELIPSATVGHIGLYRDPKTLIPVEYYFKVPQDIDQRDVLVVDPMLATGNSAVAAVERVKSTNPMSIKFLCILAAPEGIEHFTEVHPDIPLYTTAIDDHLDENGYIIPGLGDAGDRLFGTI
ncbi:MAG: uracil phosphoribosyltransferase [Brasilonema octagenarum HA4186-MV1]|jgi:uracil phosphoribosyltransferase|uniref:Uracil phosphoribosyltransferase n=2 Tax=Brasilonema TaxID=383614 RepID=A0A856MNC5_9CYAN|nr:MULTISPECIES: uracil phosphoribosyltransferase [Brasilonema]MBW4629751.1 uracil phosphoribosyltransferase [Brasilonema octagenarum HA4186-MV1]NMF65447.1 uracil phosphoribosyltransferase [Brasilonema octagenarum UFV-OR1]QDL11001.1 uracil phosphoribosyltransferase [Brasilonema sennae CENA114]QDL17347.1 uracil phosphoribosyltransferase [Brasilonema octagenarum UFV-E1]